MYGQTYKAIVGQPDRKGILNFDDVLANQRAMIALVISAGRAITRAASYPVSVAR
jgi:hypothetical protein